MDISLEQFLDQQAPSAAPSELIREMSLLDEVSVAEHEADRRLLRQLDPQVAIEEQDEYGLL